MDLGKLALGTGGARRHCLPTHIRRPAEVGGKPTVSSVGLEKGFKALCLEERDRARP